jgi:hypothetical protein
VILRNATAAYDCSADLAIVDGWLGAEHVTHPPRG